MMYRLLHRVVGSMALAGILLLAACGGSSPSGERADSKELVKLDVGYIPIVDAVAPIELATDHGYFEEEGLQVEAHTAQGGASLVPALVSDQYQFVFANNFSIIAAVAEGLDLRIVSSANNAGTEPEGIMEALIATGDIDDLTDLEGKTVAVNTLNNIVHLGDLVALEEAGVDPDTVEFIEIPFPDMPQALQAGRVDAIDVAEPFKTVILQEDDSARIIAEPFRAIADDMVVSSWVTSASYLANNPDVVERFSRALDKGKSYGNNHPQELRDMVTEVLLIDAGVAEEMWLGALPTGQPPESQLKVLAEHAVRFGLISEVPDVSKILDLEP